MTFFDENGRFKPKDEIRGILALSTGKKANALRVTYCHIGQQATVPYFAARMLGMPVRLFDGSFQEWASHEDLPVVGQ